MPSYIERIESSFIINILAPSNDMATTRIEDDPYFRTNHTQQLIDALHLLVKHALLRGRKMLCIVKEGRFLPFCLKDKHLYYRDPMIQAFIDMWIKLDTVDRTFFLINSEKNYEEEYRMSCMVANYHLEELFGEE